MHPNLKTIIGLEIHLELDTKSKLFCSCPNKVQGTLPNINICPICLGQPGVLPTLNKDAVEKVLLLGLALKGKVASSFWFDRKNYFYPDLPKGYQISQYYHPLIQGGYLDVGEQRINLERIHIEEDTAKLLHSEKDYSLLDFNRAGVPLAEIVTRPEIENPQQAKFFLQELQEIVRALGVSRAEMENGQMRCDVNISLRPEGDTKGLYPKTEIKNLNSFRAVEEALKYEIQRQTELWHKNKAPQIETTRGWDAQKCSTVKQRSKEETKDYRYFKEPDLSIFSTNSKGFPFDVKKLKQSLPELPIEQRKRWKKEYGFSENEIKILIISPNRSCFIEKVIEEMRAWIISHEGADASESEIWGLSKKKAIKLIADWFINHYLVFLQELNKEESDISPKYFTEFIILIYKKDLSNILGRKILKKMLETEKELSELITEAQSDDSDDKDKLENVIRAIVQENPEIVAKIREGKKNAIQFLIGQAVKKTKGNVSPDLIKKLLTKFL